MLKLRLAALLCLLTGCSDIAYYTQAVEGHLKLIAQAKPIPEIVGDTATQPALREQLKQVMEIRNFASSELSLPDNGSYRSYADLGRPYVIWNVFAAPEFSVEPQQWCMIFVGCVNYRGYYDKTDADQYADKLRQSGVDIFVGGVPAYSTLGYFNDPVLNTFLRFGEQEVARIVFHELAHQVVFVKDDTVFNESFASTVENEGMHRWLSRSATLGLLGNFEKQQKRAIQFHQLLSELRDKLRAIYASSLTLENKRVAKAEAIAEIKRGYAELKASWGGYVGYDQWFNQPLNNATLGSVNMYTQWLPAFKKLLEQEQGSLPRFYLRVAELARLSKIERSAALDKLMPVSDNLSTNPAGIAFR